MKRLPNPRYRALALQLLIAASAMAAPVLALPPQAVSARQTLAAQIDAHIDQSRFANARWGIAVVSLDSGQTVYAHEPDKLLQPASTAKLFTAALALSVLGPEHRIPTRVLAGGSITHGQLNGPLILYGMGDPTLGTAGATDWAEQLAAQTAARGLRVVHGDLIADASYFSSPLFGSGWEAADLQSWFAVPTSALSVQENILSVIASPGSAAGAQARLEFAPTQAKSPVDNQLLTGAVGSASDINLYRAPGTSTLYAFGSIPAGAKPQRFRLSMNDPAQVAGTQLRQALLRHGIRVTGKLHSRYWPQAMVTRATDDNVLAQVWSPPLREILQRGLKRSQNLYLQNLLLGVGAQLPTQTRGFRTDEQRALKALAELSREIGIAPSSSLIGEGTGLSRQDLVTPSALVLLLGHMANQPYAQLLYQALPVAGVDGSLTYRMRGSAAQGKVHAKTGSLAQVDCLAGYVTTVSGERLAFAIMLNNYVPPAGAPRASRDVDAIAILLASFRGSH